MLRFLFPLLITAGLISQEDALPFRLEYERGDLGLDAGRRNELGGGVKAWYGGILLHGDAMAWVLSPLVPEGQLWLDHLALTPGEAGPSPDRVVIDSLASEIPDLGFHGRFEPNALNVRRMAIDPALPTLVRWQVEMLRPGFFAGSLLLEGVWVPHAGWADRIVIDMVAEDDGQGVKRCRSIHLFGKPALEGAKAQRCRMDRLREQLATPEALAAHDPEDSAFAIESSAISIHFDETGSFQGLTPSGATTMYHTPPQGLRIRSRSGLDPVDTGG